MLSTNPSKKRFTCSKCNMEFGYKTNINTHLKRKISCVEGDNSTPTCIITLFTNCQFCSVQIKTGTAVNFMEKHLEICPENKFNDRKIIPENKLFIEILREFNILEDIENKQEILSINIKYKGVQSKKNGWYCQLSYEYKKIQYSFDKIEHAAYWYDQLALKYYQEFANINGIEKPLDFVELEEQPIIPTWIKPFGNKYLSSVKFNNKIYEISAYDSLEEAINAQNNKWDELYEIYMKDPITIIRNSEGIAIIKYKTREILVSGDDYQDLLLYPWSINKDGYVYGTVKGRCISMHRYIMRHTVSENIGKVVDHANGNTLDNRRENLRYATSTQNNHNRHR